MTERTFRSGGIDINASEVHIAGDVVGHDQIIQNISHIINTIAERPLTAAEETDRARSIAAQQLKQGVTAYIERLRDRVTVSTDTGGPYKGLLEYRLSDAAIFFGRTQATRDLLERLQRSSLTILHAESGAGKTSLLQAGISPHLIAVGHLPIYLRPYNVDPALAIKQVLVANLSDWPQLAESSLRDFLSQVGVVLGAQTTLYVFLDQFEEFFTQLDETTRVQFVNELADCLDDESLNVRWVLALRSEFFGNLANFRPRIRNPFENDYRLNRLTRAEAREAVNEPAARQGITFEDGLIDTLLDDLGKEEVAPPQVQLVCSALYETLPANTKVITRQVYADQHGAEGILREHLGRVLHRDLPANQRPIAQYALEALITSDAHRVLRTRAELAAEVTLREVQPSTLDQVLSQLVDSRLLRAEEIDGQLSYELAHDYLLTEIQLDPAVQARKAAQELLEQEVHAYQRYGTLLSDDKFAILAPRRNELALSADAQTLLQKSERALKRRQRLVFGGIGLVIALMIIGAISIVTAIGAGQQQQSAIQIQHIAETETANANDQKAGALSSAATAQAQQINAQALQATAEAGALAAAMREAVANDTLRRAFERTGVVPVGQNPGALIFDGKRIWVGNRGSNTVQSIDPATGQVGALIKVGYDPSALAFDGKRLWVANYGSTLVQSIDPSLGQIGTEIDIGYYPTALVFDGTRLWLANSGDSTVRSIDPTTGQVGTPITVGKGNIALVFDGLRLWAASSDAGTVQFIDPSTGQVSTPIEVGKYPISLAFDGIRLWVANQDDNSVQSIDPTTGQVGIPVRINTNPYSLAFDGVRLWVANRGSNTVQSIDPTTGQVNAPITVGTYPDALASDGTHLWVANWGDNSVQEVNLSQGDLGSPILVDSRPSALAFDTHNTRLWVANSDGNTVQSIDPTTGQISATIKVGQRPGALAFDGTRLWVANTGDNTLQSIDPTTGQASAPIDAGERPGTLVFDGTHLWFASWDGNIVQYVDLKTNHLGKPIAVGNNPIALAFDGKRLWVTNETVDTIQSIDPTTNQVGISINIRSSSSAPAIPAALTYDGKWLWVANWGENTVRPIDPTSGQVYGPIAVGNNPIALAFDGAQLWVANRGDDTVQSINLTPFQVGKPIKVGKTPIALAFDTLRGRLWVANSGDNTVQYIVIHK